MPSSQSLFSLSPAPKETIEIQEFDQTNNLITTYLKTSTEAPKDGCAREYFKNSSVDDQRSERVDVKFQRQQRTAYGYGISLMGAFLPVGYPESVSEDYLEYQIYDSLQAFSSSIAGMLSSRAVLEGIGVGSTHTTPTNALLLSILQESLGRLATILFASRLGPALEAECKFYRLAADVFNDCAMLLDCLSPALPTTQRVVLLSGSSVLRALCGIAAGSSKASLSLHFAKKGNVADLAAKDSSQETVISLFGMLVGSVVITHITTKTTTWITLILLLSIHLYTNYRAVRAVTLNTLNQQRANLLFSTLVSSMSLPSLPSKPRLQTPKTVPLPRLLGGSEILTQKEISYQERIFTFRDGVLRWTDGTILARCKLGVKLSSILDSLPQTTKHASSSGSYKTETSALSLLLDIFKSLDYLLFFDRKTNTILVSLKKHNQTTYLQAWFHAFLLLRYLKCEELKEKLDRDFKTYAGWEYTPLEKGEGGGEDAREKGLWSALWVTASYVERQWGNVGALMEDEGWDVDVEAMITVGVKWRVRVKGVGDEDEGDSE